MVRHCSVPRLRCVRPRVCRLCGYSDFDMKPHPIRASALVRSVSSAGTERGRDVFSGLEEAMTMTKRELIEPNSGDKRYVPRDKAGQFTKDQVDVGKSLAADRRQHSSTPALQHQG
jgi:hypothetical protein